MRTLLLSFLALSSSSCVALLPMSFVSLAIGMPAESHAARVGRAREAAYQEQLKREAELARSHYNANVRDVPEARVVIAMPAELSAPPLLAPEPIRKPLRAGR